MKQEHLPFRSKYSLGFSVSELMIVVGIVGVLMVIVSGSVQNIRRRSFEKLQILHDRELLSIGELIMNEMQDRLGLIGPGMMQFSCLGEGIAASPPLVAGQCMNYGTLNAPADILEIAESMTRGLMKNAPAGKFAIHSLGIHYQDAVNMRIWEVQSYSCHSYQYKWWGGERLNKPDMDLELLPHVVPIWYDSNCN